MANKKKRVVLKTPPFRVSFPQVFEPESYDGGKPKYSVVALFYPGKMNEAEKKAFEAMKALAHEVGMDFHKTPLSEFAELGMKKPFRDGKQKKDMDGYGEGCVFCTLSSKMRPGLVDRNREPIINPEEFYPGCWGRASITCYGYDNKGKGVAFGLQNLQKLRDDESFSQRVAAEDDFDDDFLGDDDDATDDFMD